MKVVVRKQYDWRVPFFAGFMFACLLVIWAGCTDDPQWTETERECAAFMSDEIDRANDKGVSDEAMLGACREYIEEYGPWGRWNDEE